MYISVACWSSSATCSPPSRHLFSHHLFSHHLSASTPFTSSPFANSRIHFNDCIMVMEGLDIAAQTMLGKRKRTHDNGSSPMKLYVTSEQPRGRNRTNFPSRLKRSASTIFEVYPPEFQSEDLQPESYDGAIYDDSFGQTTSRLTITPTDIVFHTPRRQKIYARIRRPLRERESLRNGVRPNHDIILPGDGTNHTHIPRVDSVTERLERKRSLLDPCNVCYKAPKLKSHLASYSNCRRCDERTCFICIRSCEEGPCGDRTICSKCCVEEGADGMVVCFDCLAVREKDVRMLD